MAVKNCKNMSKLSKKESDKVFRDIDVMIVTRSFNQKEDLVTCKKLSLKSMFTEDKSCYI